MSGPSSSPLSIFSLRGTKTVAGRYCTSTSSSPDSEISPTQMIAMSTSPTSVCNEIISKKEYSLRVNNNRKEFLVGLYSDILEGIAMKIENDTRRMRSVKIEAEFPIPEPYDRSKVESIISGYFEYLGWCVVIDKNRDEDLIRVTIQ